MFTVSMALGSRELARRGVLVTRLSAIEDAATMDVLCVDKTGTLTLNQLAVTGLSPSAGATEDDLLWAGAWASKRANQDPIDLAVLALADARGALSRRPPATGLAFAPFDPATRRTEAVLELGGQRLRVMKGSLEAVAQACRLDAAALRPLADQARAQALLGGRTLALAQGPEAGPLTLLGLITLQDSLRPDAKALVAALQALGISVKMLTGDALEVAQEAGRRLGLPQVRRMGELRGLNGPDAQGSAGLLAGVDGLAEVYPQDKFAVVEHLQAAAHCVGMSGDGVNDAPALRQAEVGIAVSSATDVAKRAASVVLTEPGLANIVALVEQGRSIYQRIVTYIINKVSRTILKSAYVALAYLATGQLALSALGMLLLIFITDFAKVSLATDHVRSSLKPDAWKLGRLMGAAGLQGACMSAEALGALAFGWRRFGLGQDPAALSSYSFLLLLYFAAFSILSARERSWCWSTRPSAWVLGAVGGELLLGSLVPHCGLPGLAPLPWGLQAGLATYALAACLGLNDAVKVGAARWRPEPA
jgi:magnesium-transporting ATPase (P-type)